MVDDHPRPEEIPPPQASAQLVGCSWYACVRFVRNGRIEREFRDEPQLTMGPALELARLHAAELGRNR